MPIPITMPRLSDTMEEGTLIKWHVSVGDKVSSGQNLADVETDKATMELQTFDDGTVARIIVDEGQTTAVGDTILILAEDGESVDDAAKASDEGDDQAGGKEEKTADKPKEENQESDRTDEKAKDKADDDSADAAPEKADRKVRVSPLARRMAEEHDLDLADIKGSGPDGRIIKRDILQAVESGSGAGEKAATAKTVQTPKADAPTVAPAQLEAKTISLSNMRKTIARRLVESKTTIPHFQVTLSINMDPLIELRQTLNAQLESQGVKLSVNDFITRAIALACVQHPVVNSSWHGDNIVQHGTVNVGIAVALPEERGGGLVVPVLRDVQNKGLRQISAETKTIAKKARETGLKVEEMEGGTITISNLGMYGVDQFTAIINPPQAAILAVAGAIEKPVVRDGQIVIGHEMSVTMSADHRVIDGAAAAEYLQTLKQLLENPAALLV